MSSLAIALPQPAVPSVHRGHSVALLGLAWVALIGSARTLPFFVHLLVATAALVTLMVVAHDSIHSAAHRDVTVNRAVGWLASIACGVPFVMLATNHLRHHRLVDTDEDPEGFCLGPAWQLLARWPAMLGFYYFETWPRLTTKARWQSAGFLAVVVAAVVLFPALWWAWVAPLLLASTLFALCTVWLPHGPWGELVMRAAPWLTGFHDDHHARPGFPVHQYAQLHRWHVATGVLTRRAQPSLTISTARTQEVAEVLSQRLVQEGQRAFDAAPLLERAAVELALGSSDERAVAALGEVRRGATLGPVKLSLLAREFAYGRQLNATTVASALGGGLDLTLQHALTRLSQHPQVRRSVQAELVSGSTRALAAVVRETVRLHPVAGAVVPHQVWCHPQAFDPSRFEGDTRGSEIERQAVAILSVVLAKVQVDLRAGFKPGTRFEVRTSRAS